MSDETQKQPEIVKIQTVALNPTVVIHEPIPTTFCDGFQGIAFTGNTVRINLAEDKFDPITGQISRHVTSRLIMPVEHYNAFVDIVINLKKESAAPLQDTKKEDVTTK